MNIHLEEVNSKDVAIEQIQSIQKELHVVGLQDVGSSRKYIMYRFLMLKSAGCSSSIFPTLYVESSPHITF